MGEGGLTTEDSEDTEKDGDFEQEVTEGTEMRRFQVHGQGRSNHRDTEARRKAKEAEGG